MLNKKHPIEISYPEREELAVIWERDETAELLQEELPSEIEISEE